MLLTTPKVSVIMAVYNGARYLRQAIDSITVQTFEDFEFVIINDASADDTAKILASCDDPRIIVLENETNLGLAASLNRGLHAARAEYIARQDADDVSHRERLANQVAFLDALPQVGVVGTTTEWIDREGSTIRVWRQPMDNPGIQETLLRYCCLIHGSTMYRRQAIHELRGYDEGMRTAQDYDLWLRMAERWDMASLPQVLYRYRWHPNMASARRGPQQERNAEMALDRAIQRRQGYAQCVLVSHPEDMPVRMGEMSRRRLAQRYLWWSAGARAISRSTALQFLLIALLLNPTLPEIRRYVRGIFWRKAGLGDRTC